MSYFINLFNTIYNYLFNKQENIAGSDLSLVIERHIGYNIAIGIGKHGQMLKYFDTYYILVNVVFEDRKLIYEWIKYNDNDNKIILEFEKQKDDEKIHFKLIDNTNNANTNATTNNNLILEYGLFRKDIYKKIGIPETKDIDYLYNF